jgi:hypothetical protein
MVGIDAGAAAIALDNFLVDDRVRMAFHDLPAVQRGLDALGFQKAGRPDGPPPLQKAS